MTFSNGSNPGTMIEAKLPRRDWILLPMIALLTVCLIAVPTELIARRLFTESRPFVPSCMGPASPSGRWAIPNTVCRDKKFESDWVEYKFNSCGHRAGVECGQKSPGNYRIVLVGSSFPMGHMVPREKTFAALVPAIMNGQSRHKVELYNEGMVTVSPHVASLRMNEVLTADPDLILLTISPLDIEKELPDASLPNAPSETSALSGRAWYFFKAMFVSKSIPDAAHDFWARVLKRIEETKSATLIHTLLYKSKSQYVKSSLAGDDAGFMRIPTSPDWQSRLRQFDSDTDELARQARSARVPLVVTLVPNRAQAAMISMGEWPAGFDPYKLNDDMRAIVTRHGGIYIDLLPEYRTVINPEQGYYPVDGHPNSDGHAMISRMLVKELSNGAIPELSTAGHAETELKQGR